MRKINMILSGILALALGVAGCSSEEPFNSEGTTSGASGAGNPVAFSATFSTSPDSEMKKLAYGGLSGTQTTINWTANDRIRIYSSSSEDGSPVEGVYTTPLAGSPAEFTHVNEPGSSEITWASNFPPTQEFQAFYPAAATTSFSNGKAKFTVPAEQYPTDANNFGMDNVLLYAATSAAGQSENISFMFDNVVTVLELHVPLSQDSEGNDIVIEKIEVRAKGANAGKLAGTFTAKTEGTNPTTDFSDATFDVANPMSVVTVHAPTANWTNGTLYIALAPYAYDGLTVTLIGEDGTDRIAKIASKEGTNIVAGRKLYPINNSSLKWTENVVNMGILVKSIPAIGASVGAIVTKVIGTFDGSLAWIVNEDGSVGSENVYTAATNPTAMEVLIEYGATPLYFATGNLLIEGSTYSGAAAIVPVTAEMSVTAEDGYGFDSYNRGLYMWGVANGDKDATPAAGEIHISGNSTYDIASAKLGDGWRLPTIIEWTFLLEINSFKNDGNVEPSWSVAPYWQPFDTNYGGGYSAGNYNSSTFNNGIMTVTGANEKELYLPTMGWWWANYGGGLYNRGLDGDYWSGSCNNESDARYMNIASFGWNIGANRHNFGYSVRPVTE